MKSISDPAQRRQISKLLDAYVDAGTSIVAAQETVAELRDRERALQQRIADEAPKRPTSTAASSANLSDALAADPSAVMDEATLAAALKEQEASREADAAYRARVGVIETAIAKLRESITRAEGLIEQRQLDEQDARTALVKTLHAALVTEFQLRWAALASEVIDPMFALGFDEDAKSHTLDGITRESTMIFTTWTPYSDADTTGRMVSEHLLNLDAYRWSDRMAAAPALVEQLLASIPSGREPTLLQSVIEKSTDRIRSSRLAAMITGNSHEPTRQPTIHAGGI